MNGAHNGGLFCIPLTLCRGVVFGGGWLQRIQDVRSSPRSGRRGRGHLLSALLRAEVRATPQCRRETAPWTRGPGGCWKTGSRVFFWLDRCLLGLAALVSTTLKGWVAGSKCKGRVGGWVAFGVRAIFLLSGAPCLPSSLPFCRLSVPARFRPRPAPFLGRLRLE